MKRMKLGLAVGLTSLMLAAAPEVQAQGSLGPTNGQEAQSIRLKVGEQHVLPAAGVESFSEGVRGVVDVRLTPDAKDFVVVALNPGRTSLLLLMQNGAKRQFAIEVAGDRDTQAAAPTGGVKQRDNIRLDFYFVQLDKSYNHQVGMNWPGSVGGGQLGANFNLVSGRFETAGAVVTQALPKLDLAQARGWAKLMRHAAVITANGEKASFSGGGEVNIPVQGTLSSNIYPIRFGSTLEIEPQYDAESARLDLRVHAAVSDLTDDRGTGAPGRTTSELDTLVNLKLGESLILAGLNARSVAHNRSGLPGLSQIPLLGLLFGSDRSMEQHTENIVVIVPSVVDAVSDDAQRRVQDALRRFEAYDGGLKEGKLLGVHREPKGVRPDHAR
jgi:pilus assembly protein CpaC